MTELKSTAAFEQTQRNSLEMPAPFHPVKIADAFYHVSDLGEKTYYAANGYETTEEGSSLDLNHIAPGTPGAPRFNKEVYIQMTGFGEAPGRIVHMKYSQIHHGWLAEDERNPGSFDKVLTQLQPLQVGAVADMKYHFTGSDLEWGFSSFFPIEKIVVLDTESLVAQHPGENTEDIIQTYRKQQDENGFSFKETIPPNEVHDIGIFTDKKPQYKELPQEVRVSKELMQGAKHLYSHSMHDREYLLSKGYSKFKVWRLLKACNLKETGHALVKDQQTGSMTLSKTHFAIGKEEATGAYIDLDSAEARARSLGEEIGGTIHTHPAFPEEYLAKLMKKYPLPEGFEEKPLLTDKQDTVAKQVQVFDISIAPPSVPDIAIAAREKGAHVVATQKNIYCLIPTQQSRAIPYDSLYELQHKNAENMILKGVKALAQKEGTHVTQEELEQLCLYPAQELCRQLKVGLYMVAWDSHARDQHELTLQRIA